MGRRHLLLTALMVSPLAAGLPPGRAQSVPAAAPTAAAPLTAAAAQDPAPQTLPLAPALKGERPQSNPTVLAPGATVLPPDLQRLAAPPSLALPDKTHQVQIQELRPLGLNEVETLAEVNNPSLKALATQVQQSLAALQAEFASWYPQLSVRGTSFPTYTGGQQFSSANTGTGQQTGLTMSSIWRMNTVLQATWGLIDPSRNPRIAAARDGYEKAKNQYLIGLRDLRLQSSKLYFDLQQADEQVRIGQESVRSSQVSLRDARARFQAGVATKLEVLQAETQLARDQQLLTDAINDQSVARRDLARLLDLPQNITPTAKEPLRPVGLWTPSLQESIVAA
ncbi:MAG: TolC family protein, partial [Cyanobium sp.]